MGERERGNDEERGAEMCIAVVAIVHDYPTATPMYSKGDRYGVLRSCNLDADMQTYFQLPVFRLRGTMGVLI